MDEVRQWVQRRRGLRQGIRPEVTDEGYEEAVERLSRPADQIKVAVMQCGPGGVRLEDHIGRLLAGPTWRPTELVSWVADHGYRLRVERPPEG